MLDGQKCLSFPACPDSDGDGTPDIADRDIDGDGVPNNVDLSPFKAGSATFSRSTPLALTINGLAANTPTYVEFQVRPTNQDRLWYAFNVLDWPSGDAKGQIQRAERGVNDPQTYFDVCVQAAVANGKDPNTVCTMSPDDNGDIKLMPDAGDPDRRLQQQPARRGGTGAVRRHRGAAAEQRRQLVQGRLCAAQPGAGA